MHTSVCMVNMPSEQTVHQLSVNVLFVFCPGYIPVDAYENARNLCDRYYMNSPELVLEEFNGNMSSYWSERI